MSLAFPEFATSDTLSPFRKDFEPGASGVWAPLQVKTLPAFTFFNPPGRYSWGQVQDEGALLTSLSSLYILISPTTPGIRIWGCQAGAEAA